MQCVTEFGTLPDCLGAETHAEGAPLQSGSRLLGWPVMPVMLVMPVMPVMLAMVLSCYREYGSCQKGQCIVSQDCHAPRMSV